MKQFFPDTPEGKKNARSAFSLFAVDRKSKVTMQQVSSLGHANGGRTTVRESCTMPAEFCACAR